SRRGQPTRRASCAAIFRWGVSFRSAAGCPLARLLLFFQSSQKLLPDALDGERFRQGARDEPDRSETEQGAASNEHGGFESAAGDRAAAEHQSACERAEDSCVGSPHDFLLRRTNLCKRQGLSRQSARYRLLIIGCQGPRD